MKRENRADARAKKAEAKKRAELAKKIKIAGIIAIPCLVIIAMIAVAALSKKTYSLEINYIAGLDGEGKIVGIDVADYVDVCDYANIVIPKDEVAMTEEELSTHLDEVLSALSVEELTDEIIAKNYGDVASTVDEYIAYVKDEAQRSKVENYLNEYILTNSTVTSYPKNYLKDVKKNTDNQYILQFNYYNEMIASYTGSYPYTSYLEYYGAVYNAGKVEPGVTPPALTKKEYKNMVEETSKAIVKENLVFQYIYEDLGLEITNEDINEVIFSLGYEESSTGIDTCIADYGMPYLRQIAANYEVIDHLAETLPVQ
ncbi:MAG: hypothetical protein IJW18_01555 [Lachnospiraceae bacterium]|nr:hypothetical protein [Lachnospiraceae bacterium]